MCIFPDINYILEVIAIERHLPHNWSINRRTLGDTNACVLIIYNMYTYSGIHGYIQCSRQSLRLGYESLLFNDTVWSILIPLQYHWITCCCGERSSLLAVFGQMHRQLTHISFVCACDFLPSWSWVWAARELQSPPLWIEDWVWVCSDNCSPYLLSVHYTLPS